MFQTSLGGGAAPTKIGDTKLHKRRRPKTMETSQPTTIKFELLNSLRIVNNCDDCYRMRKYQVFVTNFFFPVGLRSVISK